MPIENKKLIGVLALQGDFEKHITALAHCGAGAREVRRAGDLEGLAGLIIPGGESTTIGKLLVRFGLFDPIKILIDDGRLVYGTCAGLILMAREVSGYDQPSFACLDAAVSRNAYGRQVESFEADVRAPALGDKPLRAVFIRAPIITSIGPQVRALASFENAPVLIRQGNILASSFHPELTDDLRVHTYFLALIEEWHRGRSEKG